jgi:hypothetical protein
VAAGELVRAWTLTTEGFTNRRVAEAEAAADYDARHQVICTDCGIARHERDDPYGSNRDSCPVCGGHLVPAANSPDLLPPFAESIVAIRAQLADLNDGR